MSSRLGFRGAGFLIPGVLAALVLTPSFVRAGQPVPKYSELPVGRMTAPPTEKEKPTSIPGTEQVSGLHVATPQNGAAQVLSIVGDGAKEPVGMPTTVEGMTGCFTQIQASMLAANAPGAVNPFDATVRSTEWEGSLSWQALVGAQARSTQITAIHSERVVERDATSITLDSTDAWLDPATRGFRLISKASLPLKQVATAPGGVRIFVGRDDRADGKHFVQFVVTRAKDTPIAHASVQATRGDGTMVSAGACSHHRVSLLAPSADKKGNGGATSVLQFTTILPDLAPGEASNAIPLPPPSPGQLVKDVRARAIRAHFSVSQTSRDKEPIIAISTSWAGPETMHRVFNPQSFSTTSKITTPSNPKMKPRIDSGF